MTNPAPMTIISGLLGAGKTTLLNHVLSENHGVRAAVLVNDFGAINIDAKLVVGVEGETVDLANGCICCTIRSDLIAACLQILDRPDPPEVLIVETSGVSDPKEVLLTFDDPALQALMAIECLIAVVDAELFPSLLEGDMRDLAIGQVHAADVVALNKIDLVDARHRLAVRDMIRETSPTSRIVETNQGQIPLALALGASALFPTENRAASAQDHATGKEHHRHDTTHGFSTRSFRTDQPISLTKLRTLIEGLPETVYRAKGVVQLEELPHEKIAFQMVGKRYSFRDTAPWENERPISEIVLIASRNGFDAEILQTRFEACIGTGDECQSPMLRLARKLELTNWWTRIWQHAVSAEKSRERLHRAGMAGSHNASIRRLGVWSRHSSACRTLPGRISDADMDDPQGTSID